MRYHEIVESAQRLQADAERAKQRKARERIASANRRRSAAAARYQDQLTACSDALARARATLHEGASALRDRRGRLLGWIEACGYLIQAKDRAGSLVGWYDPRQNVTRDRHGALVGRGDLLAALLVCKKYCV
jgi:hypothetical protein